ALALGVAACGGSGSSSSGGATTGGATSSAAGATGTSASGTGTSAGSTATSGGATSSAAAAGGGAGAVSIAANPSGQLAFDKKSLSAKAGKVTITMTNMAPVAHNLTIQQGTSGSVVGATPTFQGGSK